MLRRHSHKGGKLGKVRGGKAKGTATSGVRNPLGEKATPVWLYLKGEFFSTTWIRNAVDFLFVLGIQNPGGETHEETHIQ